MSGHLNVVVELAGLHYTRIRFGEPEPFDFSICQIVPYSGEDVLVLGVKSNLCFDLCVVARFLVRLTRSPSSVLDEVEDRSLLGNSLLCILFSKKTLDFSD